TCPTCITEPPVITLCAQIKLRQPREGLAGELGRIGLGLVAFSVFPGSIPVCFCCSLPQEKLHREEFGDCRGAVKVAGEAMLEAIARRRQLLAETVHLVLC